MDLLIPLTAVIAGAFGTLLSKKILTQYKLDFKVFLPITFAIISLLMLPFTHLFNNFSSQMLLPVNILFMVGLIINACLFNYFHFKGFSHERLTEVESILLTVPLFAILLAYIFFPTERVIFPIILTLIATAALIWSHIKKGHLNFTKDSTYILIGVFFLALEYVFVKELIILYNPFTLYFIRSLFVALIFHLTLTPDLSKISSRTWLPLILASLAMGTQFIFIFWSVKLLGIVQTNLVMNLIPVSVFLYAYIYYKDHPGWKKVTAGIIILICVILAQIFG